METKTAHLITGTRADVVEALTRMIMEKNPDAGEITFLELPERADFRALVEEPVVQEPVPKTAKKAPEKRGYERLKEVVVAAMDEIGKEEVFRVMGLFRVSSLNSAEGRPALIRAMTATLQIIRSVSKAGTELHEDGREAATEIYRAFDDAEYF